jgi:hypothetical protein
MTAPRTRFWSAWRLHKLFDRPLIGCGAELEMANPNTSSQGQRLSTPSHPGQSKSDQAVSQETHQVKLEKLKFYRAEIKHEFNLLYDRVNSYITSQSFLVIGFALSMAI